VVEIAPAVEAPDIVTVTVSRDFPLQFNPIAVSRLSRWSVLAFPLNGSPVSDNMLVGYFRIAPLSNLSSSLVSSRSLVALDPEVVSPRFVHMDVDA
jgi:hypothetical protein